MMANTKNQSNCFFTLPIVIGLMCEDVFIFNMISTL